MIQFRTGLPADVVHVAGVVAEAVKEGAYFTDWAPLCVRRAQETVHELLSDRDALRVVFEDDDQVVGALLAEIVTHPWADMAMTNVVLQYVIPSHRSPDLMRLIFLLVEEYADQYGAQPAIQVNSGLRVETLDKLMTRRGYQRVGANYLMKGCSYERSSH